MFNIKKIQPMFTKIVTTCNKYSMDQSKGNIIDINKTEGSVKEFQRVVAVGSAVRDLKVGDLVMVNPSRYAIKKYQDGSMHDGVIDVNSTIGYNIPMLELDGVQHMLLDVSDIEYVVLDYDDPDETLRGQAAKAGIMMPSGISL